MPKRRVLLVDDEVTVLLTMKAVLEISGFDVDTAASAREGKLKLRQREYQMVITDMRMESDAAGREVIQAARTAAYHPAVALLTAYPVDDDWTDGAPDKMLVKPMQTGMLLKQLDKLLETHAAKLARLSSAAAAPSTGNPPGKELPAKKAAAKPSETKSSKKKSTPKKAAAKKSARKA